jgi:iron only hydrogenase large subunit-like protein
VCSSISGQRLLKNEKLNVAIVSPILYAQFPGFMPNDVLLGLKQMGFDHAIDLSYYLEMFQYAVEEFIIRNRKTNEAPWPLISPICPVVTRLIVLNYPNLLDHILPFKRPTALVGEEIRKKLNYEHGVKKKRYDLVSHHPVSLKNSFRPAGPYR